MLRWKVVHDYKTPKHYNTDTHTQTLILTKPCHSTYLYTHPLLYSMQNVFKIEFLLYTYAVKLYPNILIQLLTYHLTQQKNSSLQSCQKLDLLLVLSEINDCGIEYHYIIVLLSGLLVILLLADHVVLGLENMKILRLL